MYFHLRDYTVWNFGPVIVLMLEKNGLKLNLTLIEFSYSITFGKVCEKLMIGVLSLFDRIYQ